MGAVVFMGEVQAETATAVPRITPSQPPTARLGIVKEEKDN